MSSAAEIEAALAWADRVEGGQAEAYDPYVVALARVVREQRGQIARLQAALGIEGDGPPRWDAVLKELESGQKTWTAVVPLVSALDINLLRGVGSLVLGGVTYRVVEENEVREMMRGLARLLNVFGRAPEGDGL